MIFSDRNEAGRLIADRLINKEITNPMVVAIPRGGIPVAVPIAYSLNSDLKLSMTRKIGHPLSEEFAIGAVRLDDKLLSPQQQTNIKYIEETIEKERRRIREMIKIFDHEITRDLIQGKNVFLVDDGIATGKTMQLAVEEIKKMNANKIVICTPICAIKARDMLENEVDEIISLQIPQSFAGIGAYYHNFNQLSDNEVIEILRKQRSSLPS
jgi:adenine/guanine phosphoribosyltransferase-like PRPP-binding protein